MGYDIDKDFQMRVLLNEKRIVSDSKYSLDKMRKTIDKKFDSIGYIKGDNGWYYGSKGNKNYAFALAICSYLDKQEWFKKYAKEWVWKMAEPLAKGGWIEEDWLNDR
jgi:hypothetical protein